MEIIVRAMEERDLDRIMEIEKDCFTTPWSRESFLLEITENMLAKYIVAEIDGIVAGYGGIWMIIGEGHITNIAVESKYRRMGVGKKILEGLIKLSKRMFVTSMTLEVRESNYVAQSLYEQYGFKKHGRRPKYYADDGEDAIVMWKNLEEEVKIC